MARRHSKTLLDEMQEAAEEQEASEREAEDMFVPNTKEDDEYEDMGYEDYLQDNYEDPIQPVGLDPLYELSECVSEVSEELRTATGGRPPPPPPSSSSSPGVRRSSVLSMESFGGASLSSSMSSFYRMGESGAFSLPENSTTASAVPSPMRRRVTVNSRSPTEDSPPARTRRQTIYRTMEGEEIRKSRFGRSQRIKKGADGFTEAVDRLAEHSTNTTDQVAAAAAVVAATEAPAKRSHIQFGQGHNVLVFRTLLDITNSSDDKDLFTVDPVNRYGYPAGEGRSENQRHGPYKYVLCRVTTVHFDEDERYYTVRRLDSQTEQRADPAWMEPLTDPQALEYALRAAQRTTRSLKEEAAPAKQSGRMATWPVRFVQSQWIPFYVSSRLRLKQFVEKCLRGEFKLPLRFTAINGLVLCSLVYLFVDVVTLAFLPPSLDRAVGILAVVVWVILVLELLLECLLRPSDYSDLVHSDKAFSPGTARHINKYHLFFEAIALILFVPSTYCVVTSECGKSWFNGMEAAISAVKGTETWRAALGRFMNGLTFLRCFGLVRHWKQFWILHTYEGNRSEEGVFFRKLLLMDHESSTKKLSRLLMRKKMDEDDTDTVISSPDDDKPTEDKQSNENDQQLKNAATIGTALMLINSHRALLIVLSIVTVFPVISTLWTQNPLAPTSVNLLQANNLAATTTGDCEYLEKAVSSWLLAMSDVQTPFFRNDHAHDDTYVLWARLLPIRCDWQEATDGVITFCESGSTKAKMVDVCDIWQETQPATPGNATKEWFADLLDIRPGEILDLNQTFVSEEGTAYSVRALFNESNTVAYTNTSLFFLILSLLFLTLFGLSVMRGDARRLVLGPLQRMLKIVVRYAENPLSQSASNTSQKNEKTSAEQEQLGNYETEQLIQAIATIAELLRKCWGVAGAGIISTNLARTKDGKTVVFNPTVPGKSVYALFGFVAINDFSKQLRVLDRDVMRLINDVARVVHDEVYRWAFANSGQCNKNLGAAFLMVFRIGDFLEVNEKQRKAEDVVFKRQPNKTVKARRQKNARHRASSRHFQAGKTLQLASLPGIQTFADRALLGMLKSFAGIHRDEHLKGWQDDFRLGAGVGAFKVNVIYGMDAGWAVEGAVGSEYKIDATYLSPHVNMASRMMSACKQYGVTVLLSQAVEELLSKTARTKLRHLDTVYVKGSSVEQRVFTYDARFDGADFFLFERSPEQADREAAAYSASIWETDQDLRSMRQHVSDEFMETFRDGVHKYLDGKWKEATELLQDADDLMLRTVIEEGYVDYKADDLGGKLFDRDETDEEVARIRNEFGDGACKCLIHYMQRRKCIPPKDWHGVRALMSK